MLNMSSGNDGGYFQWCALGDLEQDFGGLAGYLSVDFFFDLAGFFLPSLCLGRDCSSSCFLNRDSHRFGFFFSFFFYVFSLCPFNRSFSMVTRVG